MQTFSKTTQLSHPASVRFGQRTPLALPVALSVDGRDLGRGILRNASISGALIETTLELPLHSNFDVMLALPGAGASALHALNACVVRIDSAGLGIEWRDMASADVTALLERLE